MQGSRWGSKQFWQKNQAVSFTEQEKIFFSYYEAGQNIIYFQFERRMSRHYEFCPLQNKCFVAMKANGIPFPVSQIDHVAFFLGIGIYISMVHAQFMKRFAIQEHHRLK